MPFGTGSDNDPFAPLTVTASPATVTVTPLGRSIGREATLDMINSPRQLKARADIWSGDDAQHFATLADGLRGLIGHDALRRRDDDGAHTTQHARNLVLATIDAQPRAAHTLDAVDDRTAFVILQVDRQERLAFVVAVAEVRDVTLILQYLEDRGLQLRRADRHAALARGLAVAD